MAAGKVEYKGNDIMGIGDIQSGELKYLKGIISLAITAVKLGVSYRPIT
jgi:hypothetical protein